MSFRELVLEAIRMERAGTAKEEIHRYLSKRAQAFGFTVESGDEDAFEIRRVETGEIITFGREGYSYRPS
jgi:hypothetical protein